MLRSLCQLAQVRRSVPGPADPQPGASGLQPPPHGRGPAGRRTAALPTALVPTHESGLAAARLRRRWDAALTRQEEPRAQQVCPQHSKNSSERRGRAESRSRFEGSLVKHHVPSRTTESQLTRRQNPLALLRPAPTEPNRGVFTSSILKARW